MVIFFVFTKRLSQAVAHRVRYFALFHVTRTLRALQALSKRYFIYLFIYLFICSPSRHPHDTIFFVFEHTQHTTAIRVNENRLSIFFNENDTFIMMLVFYI